MSDTPRTTEKQFEMISDLQSGFRYVVSADFARQLERELSEAKKWKDEDPRMLREQIRVADLAYNRLHEEANQLRTQLLATEAAMVKMREAFKELLTYLYTINEDTAVGFSAPMPVHVLERAQKSFDNAPTTALAPIREALKTIQLHCDNQSIVYSEAQHALSLLGAEKACPKPEEGV